MFHETIAFEQLSYYYGTAMLVDERASVTK